MRLDSFSTRDLISLFICLSFLSLFSVCLGSVSLYSVCLFSVSSLSLRLSLFATLYRLSLSAGGGGLGVGRVKRGPGWRILTGWTIVLEHG